MFETCSVPAAVPQPCILSLKAHQQDAFHCPAHTFLLVPASCGHIALCGALAALKTEYITTSPNGLLYV